MTTNEPCVDYTQIIIVGFLLVGFLIAYYKYIDYQVKMLNSRPEKKNKITVRVLAAGFSIAYSTMLLPTAKETLDFQLYTVKIELYYLIRALIFLGAIGFGLITAGTFLSNIKGNGRN